MSRTSPKTKWHELKKDTAELLHYVHGIYFLVADVVCFADEFSMLQLKKLDIIHNKLDSKIKHYSPIFDELHTKLLMLDKKLQLHERKIRDRNEAERQTSRKSNRSSRSSEDW